MASPIRRVHFIEFNAKVGTLQMYPVFPKYGTPLLAALLKGRGYDARIFLEGVSDMAFEKLADCDAACFPVFAPALNKVRECAARFRAARPKTPLIAGGPQACLFPETVAGLCDFVVRCEGDEALPELLDRLGRGEDAHALPGISYRRNGATVHNPDRPPPAVPDLGPDFALIEGFDRLGRGPARMRRVVNTLQTSRGCRFKCKFCPTAKLFGGSYRTRSIDAVVADIRARRRHNPFFFVVDNSFLGDRAHAVKLLDRLARERLGAAFIVFERHEIGFDDEMLALLARAGVRCIIVGMESLEDSNLQAYDKRQTSAQAIRAVENIRRHGMHVIGTFVIGADGDTKTAGDRIAAFVEATGISLNLFIVHDLEEDESKGLFIPLARRFQTHYLRADANATAHYDYMTGSFVTYFPKRMKPSTLQAMVFDVYDRVYTHGRILRRLWARNTFTSVFGIAHGYGIKRMNASLRETAGAGYLDHLRRIEDGLYDADENLIESRLAELPGLPSPPPLEESAPLRGYDRRIALLVLSLLHISEPTRPY